MSAEKHNKRRQMLENRKKRMAKYPHMNKARLTAEFHRRRLV